MMRDIIDGIDPDDWDVRDQQGAGGTGCGPGEIV